MRSALIVICLAGSTVGALGVESMTVAPLPTAIPFFIRAGVRGAPFAGGAILDRTVASGCADAVGERSGGRELSALAGTCPRPAEPAGHDRVWLRSYLDRLPRAGRGPSFEPEAIILDPVAFVVRGGSRRTTEANAAAADAPPVPSGLPRFEPSPQPRGRLFRGRGHNVYERSNPYLPQRPRPLAPCVWRDRLTGSFPCS